MKLQNYEYLKPDEFITYHEDDKTLDTIQIPLPKIEEFYSKHLKRKVSYDEAISMVDGYGLPPEEQYFRFQETPAKIKNIWQVIARKRNVPIKSVTKEDVYNELDDNRTYYKQEILWIKQQINRKYIGYWFFNNGKPTFINGWHYFFLNFWWLDNSGVVPFGGKEKNHENLAEYRDKQRRMSIYYEWAYLYKTERYSYKVSYALENASGVKYFNDLQSANEFRKQCNKIGYAFCDKGNFYIEGNKRTIAGVLQPKTRREGYTSFICCIMFCMITDTTGKGAFIQGLNFDDSRDEVFQKKMVQSVFNLPFFFAPYHDNIKDKPADEYSFTYPDSLLKLERAGVIPPPIASSIRPFSSKFRATDGKKGGVYYGDEFGKWDSDGEIMWNNVIKRTLQVGNKLVGFGMLGSTVGDMAGVGAIAFKRLADQSHFRNLSNNGTTVSECVNLFFPSYDGMHGFIDKHGMSIIEDPIKPIMGQSGELIHMGAKTYLQNIRDAFLKEGNIVAYVNETREMPFNWDEAFTPSASDSGMPIKEMRERLAELSFTDEPTWDRYRLEWTGGFLNAVQIIPDENGDWFFVKDFIYGLKEHFLNKKSYDYNTNTYAPALEVCDRMYMGVDPFQFNDKNLNGTGKRSNGSISIFWKGAMDGVESLSEDFMGVYDKRTSDKKIFCEEAAKAAILFGCHTNIESNVQVVIDMFQEWKLDGYMLHNVDSSGVVSKAPGVNANPQTKQTLMTDMETFFVRNIHRMKLPQVISAWLKIKGPSDLTNHDLCASSGWAVNGIKNPIPKEMVNDGGKQYFIPLATYDEQQ